MANDANISDKAKRREEARLKALKLQQEQLSREKRSRIIILVSILAGVAVLGALVYFILAKAPSDLEGITEFPSDVTVSTSTDKDGGITFKADGVDEATTPVLDVYLDFMCSHCATFEQINNAYIEEAVAAGDIIYRAHPISILGYPQATEIAATFVALTELAPEHALAFAGQAFAGQNAKGFTAAEMQAMAEGLGVDAKIAKQATDGTYKRQVEAASAMTLANESLRDEKGGFGTPAVFINGKRSEVNWTDPAGVPTAMDQAAKELAKK